MVAAAWASSKATRPGPSSSSQAIDSRLPAGWPSSWTRPARATRCRSVRMSGPASTTGGRLKGIARSISATLAYAGVVAERPGRQPRSLVDEELDAGEQHIAVALDRARAATDRRVAGSTPDVDFRRSQLLGGVVLDESRIADLDIRGLGRLQSQDLDRRPGVVFERAMIDQAAVAAVLEVDAPFVGTARVGLVAEVAVADDQALGIAEHDAHRAGAGMPARGVEDAVPQQRAVNVDQERMGRGVVDAIVVAVDAIDEHVVAVDEEARGTLKHLAVAEHQVAGRCPGDGDAGRDVHAVAGRRRGGLAIRGSRGR